MWPRDGSTGVRSRIIDKIFRKGKGKGRWKGKGNGKGKSERKGKGGEEGEGDWEGEGEVEGGRGRERGIAYISRHCIWIVST